MKKIFLYGLAGADEMYRVVRYSYIEAENISIKNIVGHAGWLRFKNPTIEHVYAIDERAGLAGEYRTAWKRNTIESHAIFKDILEREGLLII